MKSVLTLFLFAGSLSFSGNAQEFPKSLTYSDMDHLGNDGRIFHKGNPYKLRAVDPSTIKELGPGTGKRFLRSLGSMIKAADTPEAKPLGSPREEGAIGLQTYIYEPTWNLGRTFQFTLYFLDPSKGAADKRIFESVKEADRIANLRYADSGHSEVVKHELATQANAIKQGELAKLEEERAQLVSQIDAVVNAGDLVAYKYLSVRLRELETGIFFASQQVDYFENKALSLLMDATPDHKKDYPLFSMHAVQNLRPRFFDPKFAFAKQKEFEDERDDFVRLNPQASESAKKYASGTKTSLSPKSKPAKPTMDPKAFPRAEVCHAHGDKAVCNNAGCSWIGHPNTPFCTDAYIGGLLHACMHDYIPPDSLKEVLTRYDIRIKTKGSIEEFGQGLDPQQQKELWARTCEYVFDKLETKGFLYAKGALK